MAKGDGFLLQLGQLRQEVVKKRNAFRRAEDDLFEAEHRMQEAVIRYNEMLPREPVVPEPPPSLIPPIDAEPPTGILPPKQPDTSNKK